MVIFGKKARSLALVSKGTPGYDLAGSSPNMMYTHLALLDLFAHTNHRKQPHTASTLIQWEHVADIKMVSCAKGLSQNVSTRRNGEENRHLDSLCYCAN